MGALPMLDSEKLHSFNETEGADADQEQCKILAYK